MGATSKRATSGHRTARRMGAGFVALALVLAACGDDDDDDAATTTPPTTPTETSPDTTPPADTVADTGSTVADTTETTEPAPEDSVPADDPGTAFPSLDPPSGDPIVVGLVNTEGTPGLDFPDIRLDIAGAVDYLNEHGGIGNRPIQLETCTAAGSPETSQACAQELTGKNVELVMVGLDLFPDYATYGAAGVPVIGMLPILPGDYTAEARYLTGGNVTTWAAGVAAAKEHYGATSVGIVSADNAGANASLASLEASLDKAGIAYTSVKGGDAETDAGYQGLMRQAAEGDPDVLFSLYDGGGCIGTMRGRASLGIEIPVITTGICSGAEVLSQVGDDALGWSFIGVSTQEDTPQLAILQEIMAPVLDVDPSEVDPTALGLGGLGLSMVMSIAVYGNQMLAEGLDVTGQGIYDYLGTATGLTFWPGTTEIDCGAAPAYPTICSFTFPVGEYVAGGEVVTIPGLEAVSTLDYLP